MIPPDRGLKNGQASHNPFLVPSDGLRPHGLKLIGRLDGYALDRFLIACNFHRWAFPEKKIEHGQGEHRQERIARHAEDNDGR